MSKADINSIKVELIKWISELNELSVLNALRSIKGQSKRTDQYEELSALEKSLLEKGLDDEANGRVVSSREFWKHVNDEFRSNK